jgi:amino acid permease
MFSLFLQDIWKVLLYSLILGAGLPVIYALGVRASALGTVGADGAETADLRRRHLLGKTAAGVCFAVVLAGIGLGLAYIWASGHGDQLSFEHGYPTFVPKS